MAALFSFLSGRKFGSSMAILFICLFLERAKGNVVLLGRNVTISFDDAEAAFGPEIEEPGERGIIYLSEPLDACSPLKNQIANSSRSKFVLIIRGGCTFYDKVINAQNSGFKLAIIYDDFYHNRLVRMAGEDEGINITSIFVSRKSGEEIKKYAGDAEIYFIITPTYHLTTWSITTVFLISFLAVCSVIGTCCFVRRRQYLRSELLPTFAGPGAGDQNHGMSCHLVMALPCVVFDTVSEVNGNGSGMSCVICLEDYRREEKLRVLPCSHRFHMNCIDSWLTKWRTFCPICKQDVRMNGQDPPPSETTPLLGSINFPAISPPNASLAHFLPFSNYLSFANRSSLAQILRVGPLNYSSFQFSSSNNGPNG